MTLNRLISLVGVILVAVWEDMNANEVWFAFPEQIQLVWFTIFLHV